MLDFNANSLSDPTCKTVIPCFTLIPMKLEGMVETISFHTAPSSSHVLAAGSGNVVQVLDWKVGQQLIRLEV